MLKLIILLYSYKQDRDRRTPKVDGALMIAGDGDLEVDLVGSLMRERPSNFTGAVFDLFEWQTDRL